MSSSTVLKTLMIIGLIMIMLGVVRKLFNDSDEILYAGLGWVAVIGTIWLIGNLVGWIAG